MILTRRAASLIFKPSISTRARLPARRTYAETFGANKPAQPTEIKNNTTLFMTGLAGVGLAACYFVFMAKPEVVGSKATGKPEKAKSPKMAGDR